MTLVVLHMCLNRAYSVGVVKYILYKVYPFMRWYLIYI